MTADVAKIGDNDDAVDKIGSAIIDKLSESMPLAVRATRESGQKSGITLKVELAPDKELPDVYHVIVSEKLALASMPIDASARITPSQDGPQLSLLGMFDERE